MIFVPFLRALGQIWDRRFRRVMFLGIALSLALLAGVYALFLLAIQTLTPDTLSLPLVGPVGGLHTLLSLSSLVLMVVCSIFLMMPVASAFAGLFLEDVVEAVEERHYPNLPPVRRTPLSETLIETANFFGLVVAANVAAMFLIIVLSALGFVILAPVIFWVLNGRLLGHEYFQLVASRRLGREAARQLRRDNSIEIWTAGTLMAVPMSVPLVNLLMPVLGVATFTHIFHERMGAPRV